MSTNTMTPGPTEPAPTHSLRSAVLRGFRGSAPIFLVLLVLLVLIGLLNHRGFDSGYYLALVKRAAPLAILAVGELFVIVSGEFDLSIGSIVTATVVGAAVLTDGDPSMTFYVIAILLGFGVEAAEGDAGRAGDRGQHGDEHLLVFCCDSGFGSLGHRDHGTTSS